MRVFVIVKNTFSLAIENNLIILSVARGDKTVPNDFISSYTNTMLSAKEASNMLQSMSLQERLQALQGKVKEKTRAALEQKIRETIAWYERDIEIVLKSDICTDRDEDIRALLRALWYTNVKVTSDFPWYNESYTGTTTIKFSIPQ